MSDTFTLTIDGREIPAKAGQSIIAAAEEAGVYIPRLCYFKELIPAGACRVCTVLVNGRPQSACTQPAAKGMVVLSETPEIQEWRKQVVEMLFIEGNHYCMFCEKSGNCQLQALAYRFGIAAPRYPYQFPKRTVDASHPEVLLDRNRCIRCDLCVTASRQVDGKSVFGFVNRGARTEIAVNGEQLSDTDLEAVDKAAQVCPVGAILKKRVGFAVPVGKRLYDEKPIGSNIEEARK
jgi:[NiFe] hydrogenase diaphorase moiety small subunit